MIAYNLAQIHDATATRGTDIDVVEAGKGEERIVVLKEEQNEGEADYVLGQWLRYVLSCTWRHV